MRPKSIKVFDWSYLASLVAGTFGGIAGLPYAQETLAKNPLAASWGLNVVYAAMALGLMLSLVIWFFISRRASNFAKWVLVVLTGIGLLGIPSELRSPQAQDPAWAALNIITWALSLVAIAMLFRLDARQWLDSKGKLGQVDVSTFE